MSNAKTVMSQAANTWAGPTYIEDVFSTYLYTGNGSTQTITNGIDLAGEGGLVWFKDRSTANSNALYDTERGATYELRSNTTGAALTLTEGLNSFNSNGFSTGLNTTVNGSGLNYASWTFRKAPRFFDVVTYTGDGTTSNAIPHNLGITPACIIVKPRDTASFNDWRVWHKDLSGQSYQLKLNTTDAEAAVGNFISQNDTTFTVGYTAANQSGINYVAYLFAHDPLGPSGDGSDGLIACGSFNANSGAASHVELGWEPQWILFKNIDSSENWYIYDAMRGMAVGGAGFELYPNLNAAEGVRPSGYVYPDPTGFTTVWPAGSSNAIYVAIRRGPMRRPESGTEVFSIDTANSTGNAPPLWDAGFPVDMAIDKQTTGSGTTVASRLTQRKYLLATSTAAESSSNFYEFDYMDGWYDASITNAARYSWMFRRAPGFFDVVAYTGNGVAGRTVSHNLGVAPELMIVKFRSGGTSNANWTVYHAYTPVTRAQILLNLSNAASADNVYNWNNTSPTATEFTLGAGGQVNANNDTYIAYLFATLPGVSKVGSYTGNGTSQTINCGFTSGARFVLIKRTDSTGDWYVWDTARGIVAANDPHLSLNTTAAEVTTDDSVDPDNSGFIVNQVAATNINVNAASYIFYAIA